VLFRTYHIDRRGPSAHGFFSAHRAQCLALLEDPGGRGRAFVVGRQGESALLGKTADRREGQAFLARWQREAQTARHPSPCIRELFYSAYEAATLLERLPAPKSVPGGVLLWRHRPDFSLCFAGDRVHVYARTSSLMGMVERMLEHAVDEMPRAAPLGLAQPPDVMADDPAYRRAVMRVRAYIAAGDIFQANIARFWHMPCQAARLPALYARLRRVNPAPFAAWLQIPQAPGGTLTLLSASPERLFRMQADGVVDTRPIAGTRRRASGARDAELGDELLLSDKERAEHIMLVDLERNDLGRVCRPGSVQVDECMVIERYATVQHIVSNVRGRLNDGAGLVDVYRAMFPGGTITGCPKIRCMEIIHELEPQGRGPYTGGIGYQAWDGGADMNILIRTFWHQRGTLCWAAGAGIVADSDPVHELRETGHKALGLMRALRDG